MPERLKPQLATPVGEPAGGRRLAARDQVRRLPDAGLPRRRGGEADHPQRARLDGPLRRPGGGVRRAAVQGGGDRRRDRGAGRRGDQPVRGAAGRAARKARSELVFFAFDLVHLDGWDLRRRRWSSARSCCAQLLAGATGRSAIQFSDQCRGRGRALLRPGVGHGAGGRRLEARLAPYQAGRSKTWIKSKAKLAGDFVIVGYTASAAAGGLGALALGRVGGGELDYRGKVGTGFDAATLADLLARLKPLEDPELAHRRGAEGHPLGAAGADGAGPLLQPHRGRGGAARGVQGPARAWR